MDSFWFTSIGQVKVQGFLIKPPNFDPSKKYPVKFLIHGGPQGAWGDSWSYRWNAELLAANGYVVIMINPRGSTGYGQAFVDGVNGDWGGKPYIDLIRSLDYAERSFPYIDKTRECALGASYGGYMTNWILGHTDRFKCIVTHDGMFNPISAYGTTEELWFNEWEFKGKPWDYYGKPATLDAYRRWSPALAAKNFKTPTLVVHGQLDYRLDVSEGFQLFTTLQRQSIPSKMLYFPGRRPLGAEAPKTPSSGIRPSMIGSTSTRSQSHEPSRSQEKTARKKPEPRSMEAALYEYAIGALGRRMRTVAELKRLMHNRVEEGESGTSKNPRCRPSPRRAPLSRRPGLRRHLHTFAPGQREVRQAARPAGALAQGSELGTHSSPLRSTPPTKPSAKEPSPESILSANASRSPALRRNLPASYGC